MAVVQPCMPFGHGQAFGMGQWESMDMATGSSCSSQAMAGMAMPVPQMQQMQQTPQGMVFVPMVMVPVFVPQQPQQLVQAMLSGPQGGSDSGSLFESESTDVPSLSSEDETRTPATSSSRKARSPKGSRRMEGIVERFALVLNKSFGSERNDQVMSNIGNTAAGDLQMFWPDLGHTIKGADSVRAFMVNFFDSVPDLQMTSNAITEDGPSHGILEYTLSGTAVRECLPMFPVGTWVQWKFSSRYEFDQRSRVRVHQIRFGFVPHARVFPGHFLGLAQCASMLASTAGGSRLLQEAIEMEVEDDAMKAVLLEPFRADTWKSSLSPHGNHVLQRFVTCMFPHQVQFIVDSFGGRVAEAAENQMQSRILERLLEYCPSEQTADLAAEALRAAASLLRHPFGNFVLQAVLEHGLEEHKSMLARAIGHDVERLARHPIASNTVRKALQVCALKDQAMLMRMLQADPQRFAILSKHKTGSFVARELKKLQKQLGR